MRQSVPNGVPPYESDLRESAPVLSLTSEFERVNAILERLYFSPSADFFGPVKVNIEVNDGGASGLGGVLSATSSVSLLVNPVNDPPSIAVLREHRRSGGRGPLPIKGMEIEDVDGAEGETVTVLIEAERGSIAVDSSPKTLVREVLGDDAARGAGVTVVGLLPDVRRALLHVWFVLPSEGWEGGSAVTISATDRQGATGSAECVVVVSDPDLVPSITATNEAFVAGQGIKTSLTGLGVTDLVEEAAILDGLPPPTFSVVVATEVGGVGLSAVPPGLSTLPGSETSKAGAAAVNAGEGLQGVFGTVRSTLSFRGTFSTINAALDAVVYVSANDSTGLGNHYVTVEVTRQGKLDGRSARRALVVDVHHVNQPPAVHWDATSLIQESPEVGGFSLRGLGVVDNDLVEGELLTVELETLVEGDSLVIRSEGAGLEFSRGSADGVSSPSIAFRGSATSIADALSVAAIVPDSPGMPRVLAPALRVTVRDRDGGEASRVVEVHGSHLNAPPEVTITKPQPLFLKEGGVMERLGELAGIEIADEDVEDSSQGLLEVNVSVSHRAVLEVQNITTSATSIHSVQTVTTRSATDGSNSTVGGTFNLTLDMTGLCEECGMEETSPIWHDAVGMEDDVRTGFGSGSETGESIQAKLEALPSMQAMGIAVHCQRNTSLNSDGGREWRVSFIGAPASLPMMYAEGDSLLGDAPFVEVAYETKGNSLSGSFALSLGGYQTGQVPHDAAATDVAAALEALPSVRAVGVTTPYPPDPQGGRRWSVTFFDTLDAGGDVPLMQTHGEALGGRGSNLQVAEATRGEGTPEVWEVGTSAAHYNLVSVITLTNALHAKGHFTLGLDYGGRQAWTRPIHPGAVGPASDENGGFWTFGGIPGQKRGESVEARLLTIQNWGDLGPDAGATVKRIDSADGYVVTWAITFVGVPEDLEAPRIESTRLTGGAAVSAVVAEAHNRIDGFFQLSYGSATTPPLAHDSSGADIASALHALDSLHASDVGTGVVAATKLQGTTLEGSERWSIAFLRDPELPANLTARGTSTTGLSGGSAKVSTALVRRGGRGAILHLVGLGGRVVGLPGYTVGESLTVRGKPDVVTRALSSLSYSPRAGWNGGVDLILRAYDGGFTGVGGAQSGWGVISMVVEAVNDPAEVLWCGNVLGLGGANIDGVGEDAPFRLVDYDCEGGDTPASPTSFDHADLGGPGLGLTVHDPDGAGSIMKVRRELSHPLHV